MTIDDAGGTDGGSVDGGSEGDDGGVTGTDGGVDGGVDAGSDDAGVRGTARYLDRCTNDGDCESGRCVDDTGGSRMCTRACTTSGECADEHACSGGVCLRDDTGAVCAVATPETCRLGLCLGPTGGSGQCTRPCDSANECPAGYACTDVGAAFRVCVDIEKPCTAGGTECGSSLCVPGVGCTARCRSAADCPARRYPGLPQYTCQSSFGSSVPVCTPPLADAGGDVAGDDAMGALCPASGLNECRSGLCADLSSIGTNLCIQTCNAEGGCPVGWGCKPELLDDGSITTFCVRAGNTPIGGTCSAASQCASGLCDSGGYCTRLCADGLCPTGWTCTPLPGSSIGICRR
ncbi:MAG: hypothetical protein H6722_30930 [Sandaracinus sp.]|nr:hypothetical protein [Sandaracinus sp.]